MTMENDIPFKPLDPLEFASINWPDVRFYNKQKEIIYSVEENPETFVQAGNMLGKDFVAGHIALSCFLRYPTVRIITTSVKDDHLRVLWGEIQRFINTSRFPLLKKDGGPLIVNHREIKKTQADPNKKGNYRTVCPISYMIGAVSEKGEGMAGHHAPHTLAILDEASGIDDLTYTQIATWAKRILVIGNPNPCTNFFYKACKAGNVLAV